MSAVPAIVSIWVFVIAVTALAVGVHAVIQWRIASYERMVKHNDVAGFLLSVVGVIYAVVLGFVVIVAWQKYGAALDNADQEVAGVSDLYRTAAGFPAPLRATVRRELHSYVELMINKEWPEMARGVQGNEGLNMLEKVAYAVNTFRPSNAGEADVHQQSLGLLTRLFDARRMRSHENSPSIAPILWAALVVGGLATLGFSYLFGVEARRVQLLMTGIVACVIAIMFATIIEFNRPFSGGVGIPSAGWTWLAGRLPYIR